MIVETCRSQRGKLSSIPMRPPPALVPLTQHPTRRKLALFWNDYYADQIRQAAAFDEPQKRIGELLRALRGQWVPSELIGIVASAKEYQEDFQRRIRDLRYLGWDYEQQKRHNEGARVRTYYRLTKDAPQGGGQSM